MSNATIKSNIVFNTIYKLLNIVFPLITSIYLARILKPVGVGQISYAKNIVSYFVTFSALGIPNYGIREIAKLKKEKKEILSRTFWELFSINLFSTIIWSIVYYLMVLFNHTINDKSIYYILGLLIAFNIFNIDWFYQGKEEYKYIAARNFIIKIVAFIAVLLYVKDENDCTTYVFIYCFAQCGNYLLNVIHARRYLSIIKTKLNYQKHLKSIFILMATTLSLEIYSQIDVTMLGAMCDASVVAYYTYAVKIIKLIAVLLCSITTVLLPRLSFYYSINEKELIDDLVSKVLKILLVLCFAASLGIFFVSDTIIMLLYGQDYAQAINTMKVLSPLVWICTLGNLFGTQILVTVHQEKKLMYSTLVGAVINIILNYILISVFQHNGAAMASVASEFAVMFIQFWFAKKYVNFKLNIKFCISEAIALCVLFITEKMIHNFYEIPLVDLLFSCILGISIYFISLLIMKNDVIGIVKNKL